MSEELLLDSNEHDAGQAEVASADLESAEAVQDPDADAFVYLEARILKAVSLVKSLRAEKEALEAERDALLAEKEASSKELADTMAAWEEAQTSNQKLADQLQALQSERQKVRNRLEGLLGQIDQLGND